MRVIAKARLRQFCQSPGNEASEGPLTAWYNHVNHKSVEWHSWANVKAEFNSASIVGNCVVFNIGGNKYRLVTRIRFGSQKVFVLQVMTLKEYDKDLWKDECGCFKPPPRRRTPSKWEPGKRNWKG